MSVNVREKIRKLDSTERKKVAARAAELIAEEMSLRDLRKARLCEYLLSRLGIVGQ